MEEDPAENHREEDVQDENDNQNQAQGRLNLKEWSSMDHLLAKIPLKAQKGLTTFDLELTCVDVVDDYIALGTNVGLIYWYRRSTDTLERLKVEGTTSPITTVCVISSIDYIVAAGTQAGIICIFQIPKTNLVEVARSNGSSPTMDAERRGSSVDDGRLTNTSSGQNDEFTNNKKKVQIFTVRDMHKSKITALEWSTNGMKLFSGDFNGLVIYTEMDYCSGVSKSIQLWNETCEVVQLSYAHKSLVISSIYQTLLFKTDSNTCHKIGSQERKVLGRFGAVFESGLWNRNLKLYVVRPGLRIWIADFDGAVKNTIVLKDWYYNKCNNGPSSEQQQQEEELSSLNDNDKSVPPTLPCPPQQQQLQFSLNDNDKSAPPTQPCPPQQQQQLQFGLMYNYLGTYLLTITSTHLFVIDPSLIQIVTSFPISIQSIGVHGNEIFILQHARQLIRLSTLPDPLHSLNNNNNASIKQLPADQQWPDTFNFLSQKFKKTTQALQKSTILNTFKNVILETNDYLLQDNSRMLPLSSLSMMPPNFYDIPEIQLSDNFNSNGNGMMSEEGRTFNPNHLAQQQKLMSLSTATIEKFDKISRESFKEIVLTQFKPESGSSLTTSTSGTKKKARSKKVQSKCNSFSGTTTTIRNADSVNIYLNSANANANNGCNDNADACTSSSSSPTSENTAKNRFLSSVSDDSTNSTNSAASSACNYMYHQPNASQSQLQQQQGSTETDPFDRLLNNNNMGLIPALQDVKYYNHQQLLTTNQSDLESKEVMLAKLLNWTELLPDSKKMLEQVEEVDAEQLQQMSQDSENPAVSESELQVVADKENKESDDSDSSVKEDIVIPTNNNSLDDSSLDIYTKYGNYHHHHHLSSITSNMSFGPPSGSSNIVHHGGGGGGGGGGRGGDLQGNIDEDEDDDDDDGYCGGRGGVDCSDNVLNLQLDQLVAASCGGGARNGSGIGGPAPSLSGRSSSSRICANSSLLISQDMQVDGVVGNDDWVKYSLPSPALSLSASDTYVVAVDTKYRVYYSALFNNNYTSPAHSHSLRWIKTDYRAAQLAISANGQVVWRLLNGVLFSLTFPSLSGPFTIEGEWITIAVGGVRSMSVDNEVGWMVKTNGTVHMCLRIKDGKPIPQQIFEPIPCAFHVDQISILGTNVWVLTCCGKLLYRNRISVVNLQGTEWSLFKCTFPTTPTIGTISLGPGDALWFMDAQYNLYFVDGITYNTPGGNSDSAWVVNVANCCMNKEGGESGGKAATCTTFSSTSSLLNKPAATATTTTTTTTTNWRTRLVETLKNPLSTLLPSKPCPILCAKYSSVWITQVGSSEVFVNRTIVTGHRWKPVQLNPLTKVWKWSGAFANGIYLKHGLLWLMDPKKKLFYMSTLDGKLHGLEIPITLINGGEVGSIVHVAPAPEALWVLTTKGTIYGRCNINLANDIGAHWDAIPLSPLENVFITHISCGSDVAWACDRAGKVYIRMGSLHPPQSITDMCAPWIQVEGGPISSQGSIFTKVYVGASGHMVWALDSQFNVYTRVAIFPDVPIGTEWVLVSGIEADSLAISDSFVWALSPKGEIFCRHGLTSTNFIGDYWRRIPGQAKMLTVSVCNKVWALDQNGNLMKHLDEVIHFPVSSELNFLPPSSAALTPSTPMPEFDDCEWEFIG